MTSQLKAPLVSVLSMAVAKNVHKMAVRKWHGVERTIVQRMAEASVVSWKDAIALPLGRCSCAVHMVAPRHVLATKGNQERQPLLLFLTTETNSSYLRNLFFQRYLEAWPLRHCIYRTMRRHRQPDFDYSVFDSSKPDFDSSVLTCYSTLGREFDRQLSDV